MELLCPNCQKKLSVDEKFAGQLMRCPMCEGTFTVPALHSAVAAAESVEPFGSFSPPPAKTEPYGLASEPASSPPLPPMSAEVGSAAEPVTPPSQPSVAVAPKLSAPPPSAGYSHSRTVSLNPEVLPWLAPTGLLLGFLLTFFPWISVVSANAWNIAFGIKKEGITLLPAHVLFIFFVLLSIFAVILAVVSQLFNMKIIPSAPALKPIDPWRPLIVGGLAGLAWCFLTLQYVIWLFADGAIPLNIWGILAWWVYTVAVVGALFQFWLQQRGPSKPLPRVSIEW